MKQKMQFSSVLFARDAIENIANWFGGLCSHCTRLGTKGGGKNIGLEDLAPRSLCAGRETYASGFAALKSLDCISDNQVQRDLLDRKCHRQSLRRYVCAAGCAFLLSCAAGAAFGLPPVKMTDDEHSALNLTKTAGRAFDILDCQMRVEGDALTYELVHSKGRLPIPPLAVKQIQDDGLVEIKVNARLGNLSVTRLWLPYAKQKNGVFRGWGGMAFDGRLISGHSFSLLVDASSDQVVSTVQKQRAKMVVLDANSSDSNPKHRIVTLLSGVPKELDATGYGVESWSNLWPRATTIDYRCAVSETR